MLDTLRMRLLQPLLCGDILLARIRNVCELVSQDANYTLVISLMALLIYQTQPVYMILAVKIGNLHIQSRKGHSSISSVGSVVSVLA